MVSADVGRGTEARAGEEERLLLNWRASACSSPDVSSREGGEVVGGGGDESWRDARGWGRAAAALLLLGCACVVAVAVAAGSSAGGVGGITSRLLLKGGSDGGGDLGRSEAGGVTSASAGVSAGVSAGAGAGAGDRARLGYAYHPRPRNPDLTPEQLERRYEAEAANAATATEAGAYTRSHFRST